MLNNILRKISHENPYLAASAVLCFVLLIPDVQLLIISFIDFFIHRHPEAYSKWIPLIDLFFTSILSGSVAALFYPAIAKNISESALYIVQVTMILILISFVIYIGSINESVWFDEAFSLIQMKLLWKDLLISMTGDIHAPFYPIVMKLWTQVFGLSVFSSKMFSIFPFAATIICCIFFINKNYSPGAGVLFLLFTAASYSILHFAIEIRTYSWAYFFCVMSLISCWYLFNTNKIKWLILFIIASVFAAYTHHFAAALSAMVYLIFLILTLVKTKKVSVVILAVMPSVIILYLPIFLMSVSQLISVSTDFWVSPLNFYSIIKLMAMLFSLTEWMPLSIIFFIACIILFSKKLFKKELSVLGFVAITSVLSVITAATLYSIFVSPILIRRYLVPGVFFVLLFISAEYEDINKRIIVFIAAFLIISAFYNISDIYKKEKKESFKSGEFTEYFSGKIKKEDSFGYVGEGKQIDGILSYLYPGHTHFSNFKHIVQSKDSIIVYDDLEDFKNIPKPAWIFVDLDKKSEFPQNEINKVLDNSEYKGRFFYNRYKFDLYYVH